LQILAAVVQPPEGYKREELRDYNTSTPLNHLVDAVPPESDTARQFADLARLIAAGKASPQQWQEASDWLKLWRDNDAKLQPQLTRSNLTAELIPVSRTMSEVAALGLQALTDLRSRHVLDKGSLDKGMQRLALAEKPEAVLVNMLVPSIELLVKASAAQ
jgi:hexosaminidase